MWNFNSFMWIAVVMAGIVLGLVTDDGLLAEFDDSFDFNGPDVIRRSDFNGAFDANTHIYIPPYITFSGSSWTSEFLGIYKRDRNAQNIIGSQRPVYTRLGSPTFYVFFVSQPRARWVVSQTLPTGGVHLIPAAEIVTEAFTPAASRGGWVKPEVSNAQPIQSASNIAQLEIIKSREVAVSFLQLETDHVSSNESLPSSFGSMPGSHSSPTSVHSAAKAPSPVSVPSTGMPSAGMPSAGMPSAGMPSAGMPSAGMPSGMPSAAMQRQNLPTLGFAAMGNPALVGRPNQFRFASHNQVNAASTANAIVMKYDPDLICDEARYGTFSKLLGNMVGGGCPDANGGGVRGSRKWISDPCMPPTSSKAGKPPPVLDFELHGGEAMTFNGTLWTWGGYFLRRPYFELRSPLNPYTDAGFSAARGDAGYMWAEGPGDKSISPVWYISKQLGNKHSSQLMARWSALPSQQNIPANWPAQDILELTRNRWKMRTQIHSIHDKLYGKEMRKTQHVSVITRGLHLLPAHVIVTNSGDPLADGEYFMLAEYNGYPFYRQDRELGRSGFVMYRGFVLSAERDTWVIGSKLGSNDGIRAYTTDPSARIPSFVKTPWHVWSHGQWVRSNLRVQHGSDS